MVGLSRASPAPGGTVRKRLGKGQFRVVSALLSDQYFEFSKSNLTGMKGLVRGVQKWPCTQVPSNTGLDLGFYFLFQFCVRFSVIVRFLQNVSFEIGSSPFPPPPLSE